MPIKIISGGQTGVDRGVLDAALELNISAGGWCPKGRKAEDGIISARYPLQEMPVTGYSQRTRQNVLDSDGTLIIYFGYLTGGTELTVSYCMKSKRPYLLIDAEEITIERATMRLNDFIKRHNISVLNVAGPRASGESGAYTYAKSLIVHFLRQ